MRGKWRSCKNFWQLQKCDHRNLLYMRYFLIICLTAISLEIFGFQRVRDYDIEVGVLPPGKYNAITDVEGVSVGHKTIVLGDSICTGVTVILPHQDNVFQEKVPAGFYAGNGFGKITGTTQIMELGNIETPIALTNYIERSRSCQGSYQVYFRDRR